MNDQRNEPKEDDMSRYMPEEKREAVIGVMVTPSDKRLLKRVAEERGATLSSYVAEVAHQAALRDLNRADREDSAEPTK